MGTARWNFLPLNSQGFALFTSYPERQHQVTSRILTPLGFTFQSCVRITRPPASPPPRLVQGLSGLNGQVQTGL